MNGILNNSFFSRLVLFLLLPSKGRNDTPVLVSGFSSPGYSIHRLDGCSPSSSSLLFSVTPPYDHPNLIRRSSSSDDCVDSDYLSSGIPEGKEQLQQKREQRRRRTLHRTQNQSNYRAEQYLQREESTARMGQRMRSLRRTSSSWLLSKNIFKFWGRIGDNRHDDDSSNGVSNRRSRRGDYRSSSSGLSGAHRSIQEPASLMQGKRAIKKKKVQNTFDDAFGIDQNDLGYQSRIHDRRVGVRNPMDRSNAKEREWHDPNKKKNHNSDEFDPYDFGNGQSNSNIDGGDNIKDAFTTSMKNGDDFSVDFNTNGNNKSGKVLNINIDNKITTKSTSSNRFNNDRQQQHQQHHSQQKHNNHFLTNSMEVGGKEQNNIRQERYPEVSWEDRAMAIERVPPIGIPAWGPEGDLGIDARMKATMDALEDIQTNKRKVGKEEKIVLQICEDMTILQVDAAIEKKRYMNGDGDVLMMRENVREFQEEINSMSRSLRFAKLQAEKAKTKLIEVENLHWAVLSFYDPVQAKINIEKAILELEQSEPAARRTKFKQE